MLMSAMTLVSRKLAVLGDAVNGNVENTKTNHHRDGALFDEYTRLYPCVLMGCLMAAILAFRRRLPPSRADHRRTR